MRKEINALATRTLEKDPIGMNLYGFVKMKSENQITANKSYESTGKYCCLCVCVPIS